MLRIFDWTTLRSAGRDRFHIKPLSAALVGAVFFLPSFARAATIDWSVAGPANYDSSLDPGPAHSNWLDVTQATVVSPTPPVPPPNTPVGIPANTDDAFVRNGGISNITTNVIDNKLVIGASRVLQTSPDGGTTIVNTEVGGSGTVNLSSGSIAGSSAIGTTIALGGTGTGGEVWTGTLNQSGGTINLNVGSSSGATSSTLIVGNGTFSNAPTSLYNMTNGSITMVYQAGGNRGINVRSGTFNMSGGSITNVEAVGVGNYDQGFMQVASTGGNANGGLGAVGHNVAYVNFSGNAVVDSHQGLRVTPNNRAEGYVAISGNASVKMGNDLQLAANAGTAGSVDAAYAQLDMSGGYLQVGQATATAGTYDKKLIIGDSGSGVFTQTGGNVLVGDLLRLSNNAVSSAKMTMKDPVGGPTGVPFSFTVNEVETRNTATLDTTLNSDIFINSVDATFTQSNLVNPVTGLTLLGKTSIGGNGKSTFEISNGKVFLGRAAVPGTDFGGNLELSNSGSSRATLNLKGGTLTVSGNVTRSNTSAASVPSVNLTGGKLVLDPQLAVPTSVNWLTDLNIAGTQLTTRPGALLTVNVGSGTTLPGNFSMTSGSWDIDMSPGVGSQDALQDRIIMGYTGTTTPFTPAATGSLLGGTLNLNYLSGYVPQIGDSRLIVRAATGAVSTLGSIAINAPGGDPHWAAVLANSNRDIRLVYVPEPSSCVLVAMGLMMGLIGIRRKS